MITQRKVAGKVKSILIYTFCIIGLIVFLIGSSCSNSEESTTQSTTVVTTTVTTTATPPTTTNTTGNITCPELIFNDPEFAFEIRRTLSGVLTGEADVGEVLYTASRITDGDIESWYEEWYATAQHFESAGDESMIKGHIVSARQAYYRASTYYRTAEFFLHGNPTDPRILQTWGKSRDLFITAANLDVVPFEVVDIPYEDTTLPGYFYSVDTSGYPRPLLIVQTGFDGCQEELHPYAMEGIKRGYNVLTFEGPGQGAVIRVQNLPFRPDWENVITPVVDYAISRPDVNEDRIALWGISLGGYLAPRGATTEHRLAAVVADAAVYDVGLDLWHGIQQVGGELAQMTRTEFTAWLETNPPEFNDIINTAMKHSTSTEWFNDQGMYTFNVTSPALFWAKYMDYSLEGRAENISCPVLVCYGGTDHFDPNGEQAKLLYEHLTSEKTLLEFTEEYEAGYHCQLGAFAQAFAKKFDWLDEIISNIP